MMRTNRIGLAAIVVACLLGISACEEQADRDSTGAVVTGGEIDAFNMRVGDCFDDQAAEQIYDVPGRPCSEEHDNEVYAIFDVSFPSYPGDDEMFEHAVNKCIERFEGFVGRDYQSSELDIQPITPTQASWTRNNDREVICALYRMDLGKMTGSMRNSGI